MTEKIQPILEAREVKKYFPITKGMLRRVTGHVKAVDGVSFVVPKGRTLGLVGESGCGKTTMGHCIMRGLPVTAGEIIFHDKKYGSVDIVKADKKTLKHIRRNMQMIFQNPNEALNPRMNLLQIIGEPLTVNNGMKGKALEDRVAELLQVVGLRPEYMSRYPHAFSGGQRQRVVIARALALNPRLIIADEPTSALDVSIQAQILNLLQSLQDQFGLSYLFIAHDLSVVEHICDNVVVMYVGHMVEQAPTEKLYHTPHHPYTEALLSSVPRPNPTIKKVRVPMKGEVPSPANPPSGCYFHPRCQYAQNICKHDPPPMIEVEPDHLSKCHFANELELMGVNATV